MISALRTRVRPDNLKNQVRAGGKSLARRLYLASVAALSIAVLLQLIGPFVFLDADGLVATERDIVSPDYVGRVVGVHVKAGDAVEQGQPLMTLESREVIDRLAEFAVKRATLKAREAQITSRVGAIQALAPLARQRRELAERSAVQVEALRERGLADNQRLAEAAKDVYDAEREHANLESEARGIADKRSALGAMLKAAQSRRDRARQQQGQVQALSQRGLTTTQRLGDVARELYEAEREVSTVEADISLLDRRALALRELLPASADRERRALANQSELKRIIASGGAPAQRQTDAARERFEAEREEATLEAEASSLRNELEGVRASITDLDAVLGSFRATYNDGRVLAPSAGRIGARVPTAGQVLKVGELAMEVLKGSPHVLAYLPTNRVFTVEEGDRVIVTDGVIKRRGRVERLEVMADQVPLEFQNVFSSRDRQQVVRVTLEEMPGRSFALQAKVKVTGPFTPTHLTASVKSFLAGVSSSIMRLAGIEESGETQIAVDVDAPLTTGSIPDLRPVLQESGEAAGEEPLPPLQ
jgi:multidrug resistance efflux pump